MRGRDDGYQRIPDIYRVPGWYRRPYGETTGDFRGPGYFYSIGCVRCLLGALALTLYARGFGSRHSTLVGPAPAVSSI